MRNVAFIPVRGGSTSIPLKNIKPMCGKPLVYWTAIAAAQSNRIDVVYIATDSDEIKATVKALSIPKVEVIGRSAETATETASSESALLEFAEAHEFDNVVFIQATSPLLCAVDIEHAFAMLESGECDSVLSVVEDKHFYWRQTGDGALPVNYDVFARPRRQDFDGWYQENGALYVTSRERLLVSRNRVSGRIGLLEMPAETGYEIDEPSDWAVVESLLRRRLSRSAGGGMQHGGIKLFLTDCDGCLTDGGMYYGEDGTEYKKFNTRDGMAFQLLREMGIKTGIVTGENSQAAKRRAEKLNVDFLELDCKDKLATIKAICERNDITLSQIAYMGDDINDFECMCAVSEAGGFVACPSDATDAIRGIAAYVCKRPGGCGAFREVIEQFWRNQPSVSNMQRIDGNECVTL